MQSRTLQSDEFSYFDERTKETKQPYNKKFSEDLDYEIKFIRRIATFIGVWPLSNDGHLAKYRSKMLFKRCQNILMYFLLGFLAVPMFLNIVLEERTLKRKMLKTGPMILNTMAIVKYTVILTRESKVRHCFQQIESDWQKAGLPKFRASMRRNADVGRKLSHMCAVTFYCGGLCYRLIKTLLTPDRHVNGLIIKPLPSPTFGGIFRFNSSASPAYETLFAVQIVGAIAVHSTTITTCSCAAVLATHACGQFDIVSYLMNKLIDDDADNGRLTKVQDLAVSRRIRIIVQLHLKVLCFVGNIENLLKEICLVEIFGGTAILCLTGYYFILDLEKQEALGIMTYFVMITSLISLLFTYCYIGELVNNKTKKVESTSYMIDWYELPPKKRLCIGMIISISRCHSKLTAGKMLELSMYNFGSIMRSAAGYLNLLRTMTD